MTAHERNGQLIDATPIEPSVDDEIARLRAMVQARDDFIVTLTHELRNPVAAIHLQAETVLLAARRAGGVPAGLMARIESLKRTTDTFVKRASSLLDLSRAASGAVSICLVPCELGGIVSSVIEAFRAELELRQIALRVSLGRAISCELDPLRVEQVLFNLISNAIKYGDGRPIYVGLRPVRGAVIIVVRDRGVGISGADQRKIFERFSRTEDRKNEAGFGVGLWLVRALVNAMGGTISVRSRIGKGSAFTVVLPTRPRQESEAEGVRLR